MYRRRSRWLLGAALAAVATQVHAADAPHLGRFILGMSVAEAAEVAQPKQGEGGAQIFEDGPLVAIACQGVVTAVQQELGASREAYIDAAREVSATLGEGQVQVSAASSAGEPEISSTYWDAGDFEVVVSMFSHPRLTRVFRSTQIPGLPGC
jgi:hypothetical protein